MTVIQPIIMVWPIIMMFGYYHGHTYYPTYYHEIAMDAYYHALIPIIMHDNSHDNSHIIGYYPTYYHA